MSMNGDLVNRAKVLNLVRDVCDAIMSKCESHYDEETEDEVYDDVREVDAILKCNKEIRAAIRHMPSEGQPIIHCIDCKHSALDSIFMQYWCQGKLSGHQVTPDFFCGYADRKEDG